MKGFVSALVFVVTFQFSILKFPRNAWYVDVFKIVNPDRSPDPDAATGRALEGAREKMSAGRRRRRGRDGSSRILREVSVSVSGSVY